MERESQKIKISYSAFPHFAPAHLTSRLFMATIIKRVGPRRDPDPDGPTYDIIKVSAYPDAERNEGEIWPRFTEKYRYLSALQANVITVIAFVRRYAEERGEKVEKVEFLS